MKESRIRELIYLSRCGDGDALDQIYQLYHALALKLAYNLIVEHGNNFAYSVNELAYMADLDFERILHNYNERRKVSVTTYLCFCITRRLRRKFKERPHGVVISFDEMAHNGRYYSEMIADPAPTYNPVAQNDLHMREELLNKNIKNVSSDRDASIISYYREGYTPIEITQRTDASSVWVVYNVLYRTLIRLKAKGEELREPRKT